MSKKKQPMQPIFIDEDGRPRFRQNALVRYLLDAGPFDMSQLAALPGVSIHDREQFLQLIGYSVDGFGELSYVREKSKRRADRKGEIKSKGHPKVASLP